MGVFWLAAMYAFYRAGNTPVAPGIWADRKMQPKLFAFSLAFNIVIGSAVVFAGLLIEPRH